MAAGPSKLSNEPLSIWKEDETINGELVGSLVVILNGPGCSWADKSGCLMCGYGNDVHQNSVSEDDLFDQIQKIKERYEGQPYIKIYTSGSFFDDGEIPWKVQKRLFREIASIDPTIRILVESRPEFIDDGRLKELKEHIKDIEIAIGLETCDDDIRNNLVRKGFTFEDFKIGSKKVMENDLNLRTYLLHKPPLLGEQRAIEDSLRSINIISELFPGSRISLNPMNIQRRTIVDDLYRKKLYATPWLRSIFKVLKEGYESTHGAVEIISSPTGGGKKRGAHNCGECDKDHLKALEKFNISQDITDLDITHHCCHDQWKEYLKSSRIDPMAPDRYDPR